MGPSAYRSSACEFVSPILAGLAEVRRHRDGVDARPAARLAVSGTLDLAGFPGQRARPTGLRDVRLFLVGVHDGPPPLGRSGVRTQPHFDVRAYPPKFTSV